MRAVEIPGILFNKIAELKEANVHGFTLKDGNIIKVFFLERSEALVGFTECRSRIGIHSFLQVWNLGFSSDVDPIDFPKHFCNEPDFQIIAGPLYEETWELGRGHLLVEDLMIGYKKRKFLVGSKFYKFINRVGAAAQKIQKNPKLARPSYWEAY